MTLLKIAQMGHPVLRVKAQAIEDPTHPEVQRLAKDMVETMADAQGVGLAAPQVYRSVRMMVFFAPEARARNGDPLETAPLTVLINPEITAFSDTVTEDWEGCLSIPGLRGQVPRPDHIAYRGLAPDGKMVEREAAGLHARVVQHEIDHLDGVLYLDRMRKLTSLSFESELAHHMKTSPEDAE